MRTGPKTERLTILRAATHETQLAVGLRDDQRKHMAVFESLRSAAGALIACVILKKKRNAIFDL